VPFPGTHGAPGEIKQGTARGELAVATEQTADVCKRVMRRHSIGAVLVEPVQARGGINVPPPDFLPMLRRLCDEHEALLIVDEIYTGFGRTGRWFACEHTAVVPDLICLGKALTGGFPLSACVGRADLMDAAWPRSSGEAIHTSTFLGHPVGCAMALANLAEIRRLKLVEQSRRAGRFLLAELASIARRADGSAVARGLGLMAGLELRRPNGQPDSERCLRAIEELLRRGFIFLPEGEHANVLGFTPPLTISEPELERAVDAVTRVLVET
jgi:4-aminobutyrate aminotransferase-like enzyme